MYVCELLEQLRQMLKDGQIEIESEVSVYNSEQEVYQPPILRANDYKELEITVD